MISEGNRHPESRIHTEKESKDGNQRRFTRGLLSSLVQPRDDGKNPALGRKNGIMDGRSISSLTTLCSGISQRAISGASEIQSLVGGLDSSRQNVSQLLSSLASALQELSQWTSKLENCLVASTVAMLVQDGFKDLLTTCDGTMTVLHKQLMRLQSDNVERINIDFLVAYYQTIKANISLLESMVDVVQT